MVHSTTNLNEAEFMALLEKARTGNPLPLNQFFKLLYQKGKRSLVGLTKSEELAAEFFSQAVEKFWIKVVHGKLAFPKNNVGGYIFSMAKFLFLNHQQSSKHKKEISKEDIQTGGEIPKTSMEYEEEAKISELRKKALKTGIQQLGDKCQHLFNTILETGQHKPAILFPLLGLKNAREVSILLFECRRKLKVKAMEVFENLLIQEKIYK